MILSVTKRQSPLFRAFSACSCLLVLALPRIVQGSADLSGEQASRVSGDFDAQVLASGLASPSGLAVHPITKEVYVAEAGANRVSVIRDGQISPVIETGWQFVDEPSPWMLRPGRGIAFWHEAKLNKPATLGFSHDGHLFVAESLPAGRLLEFIPDESGRYSTARVVPVPWMEKDYAWKGISVADDGRLFLAGAAAEAGPSLHFGSVLMRDLKGDWWVVDYGPFTSFSSVCLSRDQDILITGEDASGGITWWDGIRRKVIGTTGAPLSGAGNICMLPDGTIVASQQVAPAGALAGAPMPGPSSGSRLVRLNPQTDQMTILATGFGAINTVASAPTTGYLYVSEENSGSIYELKPRTKIDTSEYYLRRTLYTFEMAQGLSPRKWPDFIKDFVKKLGVEPTDKAEKQGRDKSASEKAVFTIREFCDRIPMIAGRVKVLATALPAIGQDPVSQIDFVVFYPGRTVVTGANATPSLSLFSATHESGKKDRTKVLSGLESRRHSLDGGWSKQSNQGYMYFPMASCSTSRKEDGVDINLAFLGMGFSEDYYLQLSCGNQDQGKLIIDGKNGQLSNHDVAFTERTTDGDEVRNILIAGFDPKNDKDYGWLKIGQTPVRERLNIEDQIRWFSHRMAYLRPMFEKKDQNSRLVRMDLRPDQFEASLPSLPTAESGRPGEADDGHAEDLSNPHADAVPAAFPTEDNNQAAAPLPFSAPDDTQAAVPPPKEPDPNARNPDPEEADTAPSWTNLILSRAITAWQQDEVR